MSVELASPGSSSWRMAGRNLEAGTPFEVVVDLVLVCSGKERIHIGFKLYIYKKDKPSFL